MVAWFYLQQFLFVWRHRKYISVKHYSLMIEKGVVFTSHDNGQIILGRKVCVRRGADIDVYKDATIKIGDNVFINKNSSIVARYGVQVGDNCMIGEMVNIYDHDHAYGRSDLTFNQQGFVGAPVVIGDNVWIGSGVFIRRGVSIGNNVVIGAHTIVTQSIPSNSLVYGKIELVIKPLESRDQIPACYI